MSSRRTFYLIVAAVAVVHGLQPSGLRLQNRCRKYSHPRQMASWLARRLTGFSYPRIAYGLGYLDHTTAMYGETATTRRIGTDPYTAMLADHLTKIVRAMDRYVWPSGSASVPWQALQRLAGDMMAEGLNGQPERRPPHEIAATLLCALTMDCGIRLRAAAWPPLIPPIVTTQAVQPLPPLLAYIHDHQNDTNTARAAISTREAA